MAVVKNDHGLGAVFMWLDGYHRKVKLLDAAKKVGIDEQDRRAPRRADLDNRQPGANT
jgi:hypothetical protein